MSKSPVITDPTHPDFPHGEERGYRLGCRSVECGCAPASWRAGKIRRYRFETEGPIRTASPDLCQRAADHIDSVVAATPGLTIGAALKAAGAHRGGYRRAREGRISKATAEKMLALPIGQAPAAFVPREKVSLVIRQLQALGYPINWQEARVGRQIRHIAHGKRPGGGMYEKVDATIANKVYELARQIGDREASAEDGLTQRQVTQAKTIARRAGFYPPICYDEDGTLDLRAIPGHPWHAADRVAEAHIDICRALVTRDEYGEYPTKKGIGRKLGVDPRQVERAAERIGLWMRDPAREQEWARARTRGLLREYDDGILDPVHFCLLTGYFVGKGGAFHKDHPGVIEYLAGQRSGDRRAA